MATIDSARQLVGSGRFSSALRILETEAIPPQHRRTADVMRADLLERVGRRSASRDLINSLLKRSDLAGSDRALCELVLGRLDWNAGDNDAAILHFQRGVSLAKQAADLERLCWCQLRLLQIVSDRSGSNASAPLLADLRGNATRLGDPTFAAALHIV